MEVEPATLQETLSEIVIELAKLRNDIRAVYQKTEQLGCSCQKAFLQIREAMTTLREELSEASGTLIEGTFFD
jgi:DNA anti-recombination protein RmuC